MAAFEWVGDRWRHVVATVAGRWVSVEEADGDPRWPASPVIVELTLQPLPDGPAVLGVGLFRRSHFSLSVRACPSRPDTLLFEAACRLNEPANRLGSSYRGDEGRLARLEIATAPVPATVTWTYLIGPQGVREAAGPGRSPDT
ncbi:MAG: hypothetical protein FJ284_10465 [Planctomycetes bacterium]|nr:hypothetical protein [Planctomycetota bacterium]